MPRERLKYRVLAQGVVDDASRGDQADHDPQVIKTNLVSQIVDLMKAAAQDERAFLLGRIKKVLDL